MWDSDDNSSAWTRRDRLHRDLRDGAVAGLLGGGSIMIFCLGYDALFFEPLATPNFLAEALIGRPALGLDLGVQLGIVRIMLFTVLHLAAFVGIGVLLAGLLRVTGARKSLLIGGVYGLTACTTLFQVVLHVSGTGLSAVPEWPSVFLWNLVAGVVMMSYLKFRAALEE